MKSPLEVEKVIYDGAVSTVTGMVRVRAAVSPAEVKRWLAELTAAVAPLRIRSIVRSSGSSASAAGTAVVWNTT